MKEKLRVIIRPLLFIAGGALLGYLYYHFFGCTNGCLITSSPWRSMLYMAAVGGLLSNLTGIGSCTCRGTDCSRDNK